MTPTVSELLTRKQRHLERLQAEPRLNEQDEIERLLVSINTMLNSLDGTPIQTRRSGNRRDYQCRPSCISL